MKINKKNNVMKRVPRTFVLLVFIEFITFTINGGNLFSKLSRHVDFYVSSPPVYKNSFVGAIICSFYVNSLEIF